VTETAERNLLKDFKKHLQWREDFCKLVYRALAEDPPDKYIEKQYRNTVPPIKQLRQGGKLRGYCYFERIPGFHVLVLVAVTDHDYAGTPPQKFTKHAQGFLDQLRGIDTEAEAKTYVTERGFTPKMWGQWMADHEMTNPHK